MKQVSENKNNVMVMMIFDDLYLYFSCLKKSKKFVQMCMRRSELFLQISIRMTLPSARRTCRSFFPTQTSSSTVRLLCALMTTWGTSPFPSHDLYYTCVCMRMCVSFAMISILFYFINIYLFILFILFLAASGLSCSSRALCCGTRASL